MEEIETSPTTELDMGSNKTNNLKAVSKSRALIFVLSSLACVAIVVVLVYFYGPRFITPGNQPLIYDEANNTYIQQTETIDESLLEESRLPQSFNPVHYRLRIWPYLDKEGARSFTHESRVSILLQCAKSTRFIVMHSVGLNITSLELSTRKSEDITDSTRRYQRDLEIFGTRLPKYRVSKVTKIQINSTEIFGSKLLLRLEEALVEGESYLLDLHFNGRIGEELVGLSRSGYKDEHGEMRWMVSTHFHPIYARRVFPCFDEPRFRASFEVSIARKTNMVALSNMPSKEMESMTNESAGWVWNHFQASPPMPTYLVAFTVSSLKNEDIAMNRAGPVIKIWAPKHLVDRTQYAVSIAAHILHFFENYFQVNYSLAKLDLVAIPDFGKEAMENLGLIFFRDTSLLLDESSSSLETKKHVFNVIAQKIAHQWLSQLATSEMWSEFWLNEGLAIYTSWLAESHLHPDWRSDETFVVDVTHNVLQVDALKGSQALKVEIHKDAEIEQSLQYSSYEKAACLLRMLDSYAGDKFKAGVVRYVAIGAKSIKDNKNNSSEELLWSSIHAHKLTNTNTSVKNLMNSWTSNIGYPLVTIARDYENHVMRVRQSKFGDAFGNSERWMIPMTYTYDGRSEVSELLLDDTSTEVKTFLNRTQWVLFNVNQTGLYRVDYDEENWALLVHQLKTDAKRIPVVSRAQLIDDSFELANAGNLPHAIPFELISYLQNETDYIPWKSALSSLEYIEGILMETQHFGKYKAYLLELLQADETNYDILTVSNKLDALKFGKICSLRYKPCTKSALNILESARNGTFVAKIPYGLNYVLFCTGVEAGPEEIWEYLWNKTRSPTISGMELRTLYLSLGCSRETWQLFRYLEKSLNGEIRSQDVRYVWRSLAKKDVGRTVGLNFLENKWDKIREAPEQKSVVLRAVVEEFISNLSSETDLKKVSSFYMRHKDELKPFTGQIKVALDAIKSRVNWKKNYMNDVLPLFSTNNRA